MLPQPEMLDTAFQDSLSETPVAHEQLTTVVNHAVQAPTEDFFYLNR